MANKNPLRGEERRVVSTKLYRIEFVNFMKICEAENKKVNAKLREMIRKEIKERFGQVSGEEKDRFEKFIIKIDNSGKEIEHICDESELGNNFGANPKAPHFLTPIFFKKEVLDKYYNKPSKYSISDGYLSFGSVWGINIDNNAIGGIMVYLGDLGRLPYEEQKHWRLHNISKGNASKISYKRDFQAEFCSPTEPALFFKERLGLFNKIWKEKLGWYLFKSLDKKDEHHLKTLRIPDNEQKEFDEVVLSLNKILADSLNVSEMKKDLNFEKEDKSISILEKYLKQKYKFNSSQMINFLKDLQNLRSKGSAHRKGKDYIKAYKKFDKGDFSKTFENVLIQSITMLNTIENKILK